jgi:DNA-binding NtrC family response regulator
VILDDMLGTGETGLELARWLAERMPQSRVLVTTGNVSPERWAELNASGFPVLRKPLSAAAINEWMRRGLGVAAAVESDGAG